MSRDVLLSICGAVLLTGAFWLWRNTKRPSSTLPLPPGPPRDPIIGNARQLPQSKPWETFTEWAKKYGDVVYADAFGSSIIVLNSYDAAAELLTQRSGIYSCRPKFHMCSSQELMDTGNWLAILPYGERLRRSRKILHHVMSKRPAEEFIPQQEKETHALLARILDTPERVIDHVRWAAGAIIVYVTYGYQIADYEDPYVRIAEDTVENFRQALMGGYLVELLPFLKHVPSWMPGAKFKRDANEWRQLATVMLEMPFQVVKDAMASGKAEPCVTVALLDNMRESVLKEEDFDVEEEEEIIKYCSAAMYAGGADTTTTAMQGFFCAMALFPEVQEKAREEIFRVVGTERLPNLADRPSLPYVDAIYKECHRFYPITELGVPHRLTQDDTYEGYFIPAGATVLSNMWAISQDERVYKDPAKFSPERFLGDNAELDPTQFAFGFGRRICPGQHIADAQIFIMEACILATFSIAKAIDENGQEIAPAVGRAPMDPKARVSLRPISKAAEALIRAADPKF